MENRSKAYEKALEREIVVLNFYREKSNLSRNTATQLMFAAIAKEEEFHIERIKSILSGLERGGDVDFLIVLAQRKAREELKSLLRLNEKTAPSSWEEGKFQEEIKALETAIKLEKEGIFYYLNMADESQDLLEQKFLISMAMEEMRHMDGLQDTYLYLKDPDAWIASPDTK